MHLYRTFASELYCILNEIMKFTVVFYKKAHEYLLSIINIHVDMKIIWKNFENAKEQKGI